MKPWSVLLPAVLFTAVSVFATNGIRYKDRLFHVSDVKTVTVAQNVPFLSDNGMSNYNGLSSLMLIGNVQPMMYFYLDEIVEYSSLYMDIYEPQNDTETMRPVVLVLHGGAFVAGSKDSFDQKAVTYVDSLAARGFVTASLEYRTGVLMEQNIDLKSGVTNLAIDSIDFARTVYKATQDVHAAVRYLRANAKALKINPQKIYLLGNSAGGMLGLENIYAKTIDDFPAFIRDNDLHFQHLNDGSPVPLGTLESYGEQNIDGVANGVVSLWGAIHDLEIVNNNTVPVFLTHGNKDDVLPYKVGHAMSDANGILQRNVSEKYKPMINALNINVDIDSPTLYGSYLIDSVLTKNRVYHEFYNPVKYGLKHEFYDDTVEVNGKSITFADSVQQKAFAFLYMLAIDSIPNTGIKPESPEVKSYSALKPIAYTASASKIVMGKRNLSFKVIQGENIAYAVFDLKGQRMLAGKASAGQTVELKDLESGAYYLRIQGEKTRHIIIAK